MRFKATREWPIVDKNRSWMRGYNDVTRRLVLRVFPPSGSMIWNFFWVDKFGPYKRFCFYGGQLILHCWFRTREVFPSFKCMSSKFTHIDRASICSLFSDFLHVLSTVVYCFVCSIYFIAPTKNTTSHFLSNFDQCASRMHEHSTIGIFWIYFTHVGEGGGRFCFSSKGYFRLPWIPYANLSRIHWIVTCSFRAVGYWSTKAKSLLEQVSIEVGTKSISFFRISSRTNATVSIDAKYKPVYRWIIC